MYQLMTLLSKRLKSLLESNATIFISDLHLSAHDEALQNLFFQFLQGPALTAQNIYILGDLFDVWVGNDLQTTFHDKIACAFKALADKGIKLYFMAGNRDFLLQGDFLKKAQIQKLPDPCMIQLHGKPFLLTHGDKLCSQDIAYQRYRKFAQHPITKALFLLLPKKTRANIANKLRAKSQQYQQKQKLDILDVCPQTVMDVMTEHNVKYLLHGHVHRPKFHTLEICNQNLLRFVLGDWHHKASFIISTPTKITLATYSHNKDIETVDSYAFEDARSLSA